MFLPDYVLRDCTFLRICPFILGHPLYWHIVVHSALSVFCFSVVPVVTSFSFLILFIWALFFLMNLPKDLSVLFIFSRKQLLVSLIFSIVFKPLFHLFLL